MYCTDGLNVALQVWDIGGQSIGGRMLDKYIYGSHVSTTTLTVVSCLLLLLACDTLRYLVDLCGYAQKYR